MNTRYDFILTGWQGDHAASFKAFYAGSILFSAATVNIIKS